MQHEFSFSFDADFIGTALKRRILRRGGAFVVFALAMLAGHWLWTRTTSVPLTLVVFGSIAVVVLRLYFAWRTGAKRLDELWLKESPERRITWRLDDEALEILIGVGRARYEWRGLRRLWRYSDVWLLEVVKDLSVFFPPEAAPEPVREFLVERCRAAGVRV